MDPPGPLRDSVGKGKFATPPLGDDAWLWFYPYELDTRRADFRVMFCDNCKVRWETEVDHDTKHINCWSCGRFQKRPYLS